MKKLLIILAATTISIVSCKKDEGTPAPTTSKVLVVHASPNAPAVDILVDNQEVDSSLAYLENTGYLTVNGGTRNVKVNVANTATTVINANVTFDAGKSYSVFAVDSVSKISAVVLLDSFATPTSTQSIVRFVHLSPNAPAVNVTVAGTTTSLFTGVAFKNAQITTITTPSTAIILNVSLTSDPTNTVLSVPNVTLVGGKIYTIYARGFAGATGATALGASIIANN